jgi:anhydro-N-acetylmuramic acid kinase
LMSGTSMDGVDLALLKTNGHDYVEAVAGTTYPYDQTTQAKIRSILGIDHRTDRVKEIESLLTQKHTEAVNQFLQDHSLTPQDIKAIGLHGQTIFHRPREGAQKARTLQIGDGEALAKNVGIDVVYGLRYRDVEHGGEGAPLAPIFHKAITSNSKLPVAILNIGGVSNVTYIGKEGLYAFDTGPGNALLNDWVFQHTGEDYDPDGTYAAAGEPHISYVKSFVQHPYFQKTPPKSLDRNTFKIPFGKDDLSLEDGAATLLNITIESIKQAEKFLPDQPKTWIITGGGLHNKELMKQLKTVFAPASVIPIEDIGWSSDDLEAHAFAYLAARSIQDLPLSFPGTTGVKAPTTGGLLAHAGKRIR